MLLNLTNYRRCMYIFTSKQIIIKIIIITWRWYYYCIVILTQIIIKIIIIVWWWYSCLSILQIFSLSHVYYYFKTDYHKNYHKDYHNFAFYLRRCFVLWWSDSFAYYFLLRKNEVSNIETTLFIFLFMIKYIFVT